MTSAAPAIKICGITTKEAHDASIGSGAEFTGFVFHSPSPRYIDPACAAPLVRGAPPGHTCVGLFVDPADSLIESVLAAVPLAMIQLHGAETPDMVAHIRRRFALPVIKAIRIATPADCAAISEFEPVADWLLFDARSAKAPGGTGERFDWNILKNASPSRPWMLAGGLTPENVGEAVALLHPPALDVSSGVEDAPGIKNPDRIRAFIAAARHAQGKV